MPFLIADTERFALKVGRNTLGGLGSDAVTLTPLTGLPPAAVVTLRGDGTAIIQRIAAAIIVKVDGGPLGALPHPLTHGARISVGQARLLYADPAGERAGAIPDPKHHDSTDAPTDTIPVVRTQHASGRLIELATGCVYPIPPAGLVIGRGASCDIALEGTGVSRRHALVKPDSTGFVVIDESANGTFVNGARVQTAQPIRHGDVLGIDTDEFRLDVHGAIPSPHDDPSDATGLIGGVPEADPLGLGATHRVMTRGPMVTPPLAAPTQALTVLEVSRGPLAGKSFRIERPVCAIGRGDHNEVRLNDASVSSSHASLLLKRGTWYVVDLQSANGTYVDGYRVATERALPDGGGLRVGDVVMRFRLLGPPREATNVTHGGGSIWKRIVKLISGV
jgi:pSer/pThr/pTyr-binding forkhead associated (FHA) protein